MLLFTANITCEHDRTITDLRVYVGIPRRPMASSVVGPTSKGFSAAMPFPSSSTSTQTLFSLKPDLNSRRLASRMAVNVSQRFLNNANNCRFQFTRESAEPVALEQIGIVLPNH